MVKIYTQPITTTIIQVYMPTTAHNDDEIEEIYDRLYQILKMTKSEEYMILLGDWNAQVGEKKDENIVGRYGLRKRNDRGERLIEFCIKHKLVIANTIFQNHKRRRYTWKNPGDMARYKIDYIILIL